MNATTNEKEKASEKDSKKGEEEKEKLKEDDENSPLASLVRKEKERKKTAS